MNGRENHPIWTSGTGERGKKGTREHEEVMKEEEKRREDISGHRERSKGVHQRNVD